LLKEDAGELLRRLAVICLEDGLLHPQLPLVCWCMAAVVRDLAAAAAVPLAHAQALASGRGRAETRCSTALKHVAAACAGAG
jgi:hypothetical protein